MPDADPLRAAMLAFAGEPTAGRVPSVRVIRARAAYRPAARRLQAYLAAINGAGGSFP